MPSPRPTQPPPLQAAFYAENPKCFIQKEAAPTVPVGAALKTFLDGPAKKLHKGSDAFGSVLSGDRAASDVLSQYSTKLGAWIDEITQKAERSGDILASFMDSLSSRKVTGRASVQLTNVTGTYVTREVALSEARAQRACSY